MQNKDLLERARRLRFVKAMRRLILPACLMLAACGKGGDKEDKAPPPAPLPSATAPAPRTPVMQITPAPGKAPAWLKPRPDRGADLKAPYGNLLNKPVVEGGR
ncbi:hypothetical protein J2Y58_001972 [Sphingomonas sp. BE138]|uniref:hypothetical protein n=1 Tax=Sphingomonas sp. BE138 TaxID=2817845 RepID=UPI00285DEB81|nr:hypothetical protein [Sphingomonas sp. BE138]MDR6788612.1 hypothetical protein [Sphingomonas sp. BE138]